MLACIETLDWEGMPEEQIFYLQCWEELGHDKGGLELAKLGCHIAGHAEVGVLVYGAGDEAAHIFPPAKDVGEAVRDAGGGLGGREGDFADVVRFVQAEDGAHHVHRHQPALKDAKSARLPFSRRNL